MGFIVGYHFLLHNYPALERLYSRKAEKFVTPIYYSRHEHLCG
jgi:hypothetical protein